MLEGDEVASFETDVPEVCSTVIIVWVFDPVNCDVIGVVRPSDFFTDSGFFGCFYDCGRAFAFAYVTSSVISNQLSLLTFSFFCCASTFLISYSISFLSLFLSSSVYSFSSSSPHGTLSSTLRSSFALWKLNSFFTFLSKA